METCFFSPLNIDSDTSVWLLISVSQIGPQNTLGISRSHVLCDSRRYWQGIFASCTQVQYFIINFYSFLNPRIGNFYKFYCLTTSMQQMFINLLLKRSLLKHQSIDLGATSHMGRHVGSQSRKWSWPVKWVLNRRVSLLPREHLAMSGDTSDYHN